MMQNLFFIGVSEKTWNLNSNIRKVFTLETFPHRFECVTTAIYLKKHPKTYQNGHFWDKFSFRLAKSPLTATPFHKKASQNLPKWSLLGQVFIQIGEIPTDCYSILDRVQFLLMYP